MLEHAEKFEKVFDRMGKEDEQFKAYFTDREVIGKRNVNIPTKGDWDKCRVFLQFLKLFYNATLKFLGSLYVTSSTLYREMLVIQTKIKEHMADKTPILATMAMNMKVKFDKYWCIGDKFNLLLYVVVVLDPRYKKRFLKFRFISIYGQEYADLMMEKVEDSLTRLFNYCKSMYEGLNVVVCIENEEMPMAVDNDDPYDLIASQYSTYLEDESSNSPVSELDKYLSDSVDKVPKSEEAKFDLLNWWKVNSLEYKVLSLLARDVLAMPVSTVAFELAFSTGGRILDPFRCSLNLARDACVYSKLASKHCSYFSLEGYG